jgi:hypothetical protein
MHTEFWSDNLRGRDHMEHLNEEAIKIHIKSLGSSGSELGPVAGSCQHDNKPSGSINKIGICETAERILASGSAPCSKGGWLGQVR